MPLASTSLPKPKNWQDFELKMRVLIACVLGDPQTQQNGRSGQKQNGVDIYGSRNSECLVGVQCKKKFENTVTEKELRDEVKKAGEFKPKLTEFILVTTAPRDKAIQEVARKITEELGKTAHPMRVYVWGWDDIEEHASKHKDAWNAFDPTWNPFVEEGFAKIFHDLKELKAHQTGNSSFITSPGNSSNITRDESDESTPLHGKITLLQKLVDSDHIEVALSQLIDLKKSEWPHASRSEKYRILVGIASAKLKIGEDEVAGSLLLDAYNECPEHKNALKNKATGYLLVGSIVEAVTLARDLLNEDRTSADVAGLLVQALVHDTNCDDPLKDIPAELCNSKEVISAYIYFLRCRENSAWIDIARSSAKKFPNDVNLRRFAAEAVLDELARTEKDVIAGGIVRRFSYTEVNQAIEELHTQASDAIEKGYALLPSVAHNAALALRLADDTERAIRILDAAIAQYPKDENLRLQRAILALSDGDPSEAIKVLPEKPTEPEAIGVLAQSLMACGRTQEALTLITGLDDSSFPDHVKEGIFSVRIRAYIAEGEKQSAIDMVNALVATAPAKLTARALQINTYRNVGDIEGSKVLFSNTLELITPETDLRSRLILALEALNLGFDQAVISLLKDRVATDRESEALTILISTAINSGYLATAGEILNAVSPELKKSKWFARADVILALNTGDPKSVEKILKYLKDNPSDVQMILTRVGMMQRAGQSLEIAKYLEQIHLVALDGPPELKIHLAAFVIEYVNEKKGLAFAYETLMNHWDRPKVHLAYQSLMLSAKKVASAITSPTVVEDSTSVLIVVNGRERTYRIEKKKYSFFEEERLAPESNLAKLLLGKCPGESIPEKGIEIKAVKHIYLDAFHRSLEDYNARFPQEGGMIRINFDPKSQDPLGEIRSITKATAESHQRMLKEYQSNGFPFSFLAALMGKDPVDAWGALPSVGVTFLVCRGFLEERLKAIQTLKKHSKRGCVADAITLSVIRRLGIEGVVSSVCGPIHTTQSVVDQLSSRAIEAKLNIGHQQGFLSWRNNQLVFEEHSEEILQKIAVERAEEASWAKGVAKISPAMPKKDYSKETRSIINMVKQVPADPAIAAYGNNLLLLSEDMGLRNWAGEAFDIPTAWLQPVLLLARDEGLLSVPEYCDKINMLALSGHNFISLDADCLIHQAANDCFTLTPALSQLLKTIGGPTADIISNTDVCSAFINKLLSACTEDLKVNRIVSEVFNCITEGRSEDKRLLVARILKNIHFPKNSSLLQHAIGWLVGHSIGLEYFEDVMKLYREYESLR